MVSTARPMMLCVLSIGASYGHGTGDPETTGQGLPLPPGGVPRLGWGRASVRTGSPVDDVTAVLGHVLARSHVFCMPLCQHSLDRAGEFVCHPRLREYGLNPEGLDFFRSHGAQTGRENDRDIQTDLAEGLG
jgi:hypothetical protein